MTTFPHYLTTLDYLPLENTFIPAQVPSTKLMIILHGRGGKAEDFTWIAERLDFDDMHYLLLNAPDSYDEGYSWYSDAPYQLEGIKHSSALLTQTFEMLFEKNFDASQSFLFGFSQGALLTFEFGARYAKVLAGYISISGHLNDPQLLLQEMHTEHKDAKWIYTHGTSDDTLDFKTAEEQVTQLQNADFNIDFKSYGKGHSILEVEIDMIKAWMQEVSDAP